MKKQIGIFILLVFVLLIFNKILLGDFAANMAITDTQQLVNTKHVNSQKLFEKTCDIIKRNFYDSSLNGQDLEMWKKRYKDKIKNDEDANVAINTVLESLDDPYSRYMNKKDYAEQTTSINSKITGIGVNINTIGGKTYIVNVIEDTPAFYAKLKKDDLIVKVDKKEISGMNAAAVAELVRGPENTVVELVILRKKQQITKRIKRKEIKIKTVKSSIDKEIGYIRILSFIGSTTSDEFVEALDKTKNSKGLIIDLRGNSGGLLPNAVFIANMFITEGNIVSIVGRNGYKRNIYAQDPGFTIKKPMLVLVDGGSASASEILSGALQDYHRAKLVGTKTFGKGMVQKIIPMPNETGLNLTIAKYLTPSGHDINKKGINPDIKIEMSEKEFYSGNDIQLKKAKSMLNKMLTEKNSD